MHLDDHEIDLLILSHLSLTDEAKASEHFRSCGRCIAAYRDACEFIAALNAAYAEPLEKGQLVEGKND